MLLIPKHALEVRTRRLLAIEGHLEMLRIQGFKCGLECFLRCRRVDQAEVVFREGGERAGWNLWRGHSALELVSS